MKIEVRNLGDFAVAEIEGVSLREARSDDTIESPEREIARAVMEILEQLGQPVRHVEVAGRVGGWLSLKQAQLDGDYTRHRLHHSDSPAL